MRISEVSQQTGISIDTLCYYEKEGLIRPKRRGVYREYSTDDLTTLDVVARLRAIGISIADVGRLLAFDQQVSIRGRMTAAELDIVRDNGVFLDDLRRGIEERIRAMEETRSTLDHMQRKVTILLDHGGVPDES